MALTRRFKDTVKARVAQDSAFRIALLEEALNAFISADLETGKSLLRDYVNATIGFEELGNRLKKSPKSLMRMLSTEGNPRANNLLAVLAHLKEREGVILGLTSAEYLTVTENAPTQAQTDVSERLTS